MTILFSSPFVSVFSSVSPFVLGAGDNVVCNESELLNAVNKAGVAETTIIVLSNDIRLTGSLVISANKNITLTSIGGEKFRLIGVADASTIMIKDGGVLTLDDIIVTHNINSGGRGVTVSSGGKLVMVVGEISGNFDTMGGGVYVHYGTFNMLGGTVTNNTAISDAETEIVQGITQQSGTMQHSGGVNANSASGMGGGVYVGYDSSFTMSGGVIVNNTASLDGGGVYTDAAGSFSLSGNGVIADNSASRHGGGVYANTGSFRITGNAKITNNTTTHRGGGVYMNVGSFSMGGGMITNNIAGTGGGVYMSLGSLSIMTGGEISGNTAIGVMPVSGGGGVYNEGNFAMSGGVITSNIAYNFGGGLYNNEDFELSGEGEIYNNTAQKGDNVYRANVYIDFYTVALLSVVLIIGAVGGGLFLHFKNKRKR